MVFICIEYGSQKSRLSIILFGHTVVLRQAVHNIIFYKQKLKNDDVKLFAMFFSTPYIIMVIIII